MADQTDHVTTTEPVSEVRSEFFEALKEEVARHEREGRSRPENLTEATPERVAEVERQSAIGVDQGTGQGLVDSLLESIRNAHEMNSLIDREEVARLGVDESLLKGLTSEDMRKARDWIVEENTVWEIRDALKNNNIHPDSIERETERMEKILSYRDWQDQSYEISSGEAAASRIRDNITERKQERVEQETRLEREGLSRPESLTEPTTVRLAEIERQSGIGVDQDTGHGLVVSLLESIRNAHEKNELFGSYREEIDKYGIDESFLKGMTTLEMREARDWNVGENTVRQIATAISKKTIHPEDIAKAEQRSFDIYRTRSYDEDANDLSTGRDAAWRINTRLFDREKVRLKQENELKQAAFIGPREVQYSEMYGNFQDGLEIDTQVLKRFTPQEAFDAATWLNLETWEEKERFQDGLKAAEKIPFSDFMHKEDWGDRHPVEAHRREKLLVAVKVPDLTHDEVNSRALEAPRVHGAREKAEALGVAAYGEASGVSKMIREIDASTSPAALASEKARELRVAPETLGELPGRAGGWLRGPDQERKAALAAVTELSNAIDQYGANLTYERNQVVKAHVAEQKKMAVEIPAPSNALSAVLAMPVEKQANALQNAPVVAKELETLVQAAEKRLSQTERRELSLGNTLSLEDRHDTSVARASRLGKVLQQSTQLHEEHQKQVRQQSLNRNVGQALAR